MGVERRDKDSALFHIIDPRFVVTVDAFNLSCITILCPFHCIPYSTVRGNDICCSSLDSELAGHSIDLRLMRKNRNKHWGSSQKYLS